MALELRAITRRIAALGKIVRAEKTGQRAADASQEREEYCGRARAEDRHVAQRGGGADQERGHLERQLDLLVSIKGIGVISAVQILASCSCYRRIWRIGSGLRMPDSIPVWCSRGRRFNWRRTSSKRAITVCELGCTCRR